MTNNKEVRLKLINNQFKKLESAPKNKTAITLSITNKTFHDEELLPHKLFLTTRWKTKIRNAFANNMSMDVNHSKAQLPKIVQSSEFLGAVGKLSIRLMKFGFSLAKFFLAPLAKMA